MQKSVSQPASLLPSPICDGTAGRALGQGNEEWDLCIQGLNRIPCEDRRQG